MIFAPIPCEQINLIINYSHKTVPKMRDNVLIVVISLLPVFLNIKMTFAINHKASCHEQDLYSFSQRSSPALGCWRLKTCLKWFLSLSLVLPSATVGNSASFCQVIPFAVVNQVCTQIWRRYSLPTEGFGYQIWVHVWLYNAFYCVDN